MKSIGLDSYEMTNCRDTRSNILSIQEFQYGQKTGEN